MAVATDGRMTGTAPSSNGRGPTRKVHTVVDQILTQRVAGPSPSSRPRPVADTVTALRPAHWAKNVLVFVAPGAAGVLGHGAVVARAIGVFFVFCGAASATYLVNDVVDAPADRLHPRKRLRPVASGALSPQLALAVGGVLAAAALAGAWLLAGWRLGAVVAAYMAVTVGYSLWLKRRPVIELTAVAAGFVLRAVAGGVGTHVPLSRWFLVVISFGALFIVLGKRVGEHEELGDARADHRLTLGLYTPQFLRSALTMSATALVTTYCLWAFARSGLSHHGYHLVWIQLSVAPVIAGVLYVLRLLDGGAGGSPTELAFTDRTLQVLGLVWAVLVGIGVYA